MPDSPTLPDSLEFEPVPSASRRHDGWTPERQRGFILALWKIGIVAFAARSVGMSRKSAYKLLERAGPESGFAHAWREAQAAGRTNAWFTAVDRAIQGVEEPYFYGGRQRGTRRVYDNRLLIAAFRRSSGPRPGIGSRASDPFALHSSQCVFDVPGTSSPSKPSGKGIFASGAVRREDDSPAPVAAHERSFANAAVEAAPAPA